MDASVYSGIGSLQYYGYYGWKVMTVESELFLLGDVMRERGWDYEDFRCVQWEVSTFFHIARDRYALIDSLG